MKIVVRDTWVNRPKINNKLKVKLSFHLQKKYPFFAAKTIYVRTCISQKKKKKSKFEKKSKWNTRVTLFCSFLRLSFVRPKKITKNQNKIIVLLKTDLLSWIQLRRISPEDCYHLVGHTLDQRFSHHTVGLMRK